MIYLIIIPIVAILVFAAIQHERMLARMSPAEREAYLEKLEAERKEREFEREEASASEAKKKIAISKAEGRAYARVWVPESKVKDVERWGARNGYKVLVVKENGKHGDVQLSISWRSA